MFSNMPSVIIISGINGPFNFGHFPVCFGGLGGGGVVVELPGAFGGAGGSWGVPEFGVVELEPVESEKRFRR